MRDFGDVLAQALRGAQAGMVSGVRDDCDDLLAESRSEVPHDQGDLSNSGKSTVRSTSDMVEGSASFDTPYAVVQHEDLTLRHQDGRKAGYLGDPLRRNTERYLRHIADQVSRNIG